MVYVYRKNWVREYHTVHARLLKFREVVHVREIFQQRDTQGALLRIWEKGDLYRGGLRALQHSSTDLEFSFFPGFFSLTSTKRSQQKR